MAILKGRFAEVLASEDGSNVKIKLSTGDSLVLNDLDLVALIERLIDARATLKLNELQGGLPNRFSTVPEVVRVEDFNALSFQPSRELLLDLRFDKTRRLAVHLSEAQRDFLLHVASQQGGSQSRAH